MSFLGDHGLFHRLDLKLFDRTSAFDAMVGNSSSGVIEAALLNLLL